MRNYAAAIIATALLAGCSTASSPSTSPAVPQSVSRAVPASHGYGSIFWNKISLRLPPKGHGHAEAVLSYWAVDGYFTEPNYCRDGEQFSATAHRSWGNPKKYMHVLYWFKAKSRGADECEFTAVLNSTGSPPIAIIQLDIQ